MRFKTFYLKETTSNSLIVVDIQPSYKKYFGFKVSDFCDHLINSDYSKILYLYNGPELGMESKDDIFNFLIEDGLNYDEEKVEQFPNMTFYEKNYAFFRDMMDDGYDEDDIIKLIKYMIDNKIDNSQNIDDETFEELDIEPLGSGNRIWIPEVLDELKKYNNIILCGGGRNECLREIEIALKVLNKPYKLLNKFVY